MLQKAIEVVQWKLSFLVAMRQPSYEIKLFSTAACSVDYKAIFNTYIISKVEIHASSISKKLLLDARSQLELLASYS